MPLSISLDHQQPRIQLSSLRGLDYGSTVDLALSRNATLDLATMTCILTPLCFTPSWLQPSGNTARLRKADFDISDPSRSPYWNEAEVGYNGNWFMYSLGTVDAANPVATYEHFEANRGMRIEFFSPNWGQSAGTALWFGWISDLGQFDNLEFEVLNNGQINVYHGTAFIASGNITDRSRVEAIEDRMLALETAYGERSANEMLSSGVDITNRYQEIVVYPRPAREIIIMSDTAGGCLCFTRNDLPPPEEAIELGTITPAGRMAFRAPDGQAIAQLWPLRFETSGTVISQPHYMYYAPGSAQVGSAIVYYGSVGGSVSASGSAMAHPYTGLPFVSDGTASQYRSLVALSGDGKYTPYLMGVSLMWPPVMGSTYAGSVEITPYVLANPAPTLEVPDSPSGVSLRFSVANPNELSMFVAYPDVTYNRPVKLDLDSPIGSAVTVFDGYNAPPKVEHSWNDDAEVVQYDCRDPWYRLENHLFTDPIVLDGMNVGSAMALILQDAGFSDTEMEIRYIDTNISSDDNPANGRWRNIVKAGDTAAKWLEQLHETYARDYYMGFRPLLNGQTFYFGSDDDYGVSAVGTVYQTIAETAGTPSLAVTALNQSRPRPLANEIIVEGLEPFTHRRIIARHYDVNSYVAETMPELRGPAWIGEQRVAILQAPQLTNITDCTIVADRMMRRFCNSRTVYEVECGMIWRPDGVPAWRGDCIEISGIGTCRIKSFTADFVSERAQYPDGTARPYYVCNYLMEQLG